MPQSPTASAPANLSDAELLRRYEPVLRLTKGEAYFPSDVDRYVAHCSLWVSHANGYDECLIPRGQLTLETLAQSRRFDAGAVEYLRFAQQPSAGDGAAPRQRRRDPKLRTMATHRGFEPGVSRLARVGYLARLADAGISLSMLVRGRVPAATSAIALGLTHTIQATEPRCVYYGRVVRENGWVCLNYWFFYYYDDWRSGFSGVNDHEADWENLSVFLYEADDGCLHPEWVVLSCHDFTGDDLRRRWDDREQLEIVGDTHPVAYVGAGSHAHYYRPGEYLIESAVPWLRRFEPAARVAKGLWRKLFGEQAQDPGGDSRVFAIPFVEYARGDGMSIGPGQEHEWEPVVLDPAPAWLREYHGLWGVFVRDPVGGENAPAGPMYNRAGQPRFAWYAPLAYAGLDRVAPPPRVTAALAEQRAAVAARQQQLAQSIQAKSAELQGLGAELAAVDGLPHLRPESAAGIVRVEALRAELRQLRSEEIDNSELIDALDARMAAHESGLRDDPRAHVRILQAPLPHESLRFERLAQLWSAASIGLLLIAVVLIVAFTQGRAIIAAVAVLVVLFLLLDSVFRRSAVQRATRIAIVLAAVTSVLLLFEFWREVIIVAVFSIGVYLAIDNLRDLWATLRASRP